MSEPTLTKTSARPAMNTRTVTTLAMLSAIAYVVMLLSKLLPSVNGFLDFDFKDVSICIGGFTFGPVAAAMNVLATCSFCCTASFVYKRRHTMRGAILGLGLGVLMLTGVMLLWNYLITPIYQGLPREAVAAMLVPVFLPFNLVKGGMNMATTLLLYKPVVTALRRANLIPASEHSQPRRSSAGSLLFSLALMATFVLLALVLMDVI